MRVLVTGGTGVLGRLLVRTALDAGHAVRVQSRRPRSTSAPPVAWAQADLATGEGVAEMVVGADAVLHAASDPRRPDATDVGGTRRLAEAAQAAGVRHLIYVSIVGVDRIPYAYYEAKAEAERIVAESGVPHSILRATQFHAFVDFLFGRAARTPLVLPLPTAFRVQSVAAEEVAARLVRALADGPAGRLPDFGGPEVMSVREAAEAWKRARGVGKPILPVPLPGRIASAFRAGLHTAPEGDHGTVRWADWLASSPVPDRHPS